MFSLAKDAEHSIELDESEFIDGRVLAVDELMEMGDRVHSLNRERVSTVREGAGRSWEVLWHGKRLLDKGAVMAKRYDL